MNNMFPIPRPQSHALFAAGLGMLQRDLVLCGILSKGKFPHGSFFTGLDRLAHINDLVVDLLRDVPGTRAAVKGQSGMLCHSLMAQRP